MNIHSASITQSLYSSYTKLRLAQRESFLLGGGESLPPSPLCPGDHYHMVRHHMAITLMISRGNEHMYKKGIREHTKYKVRNHQFLIIAESIFQ